MQKITTSALTNAQIKINEFSIIAYLYEDCIIKLQKMGDLWGFVNLSNPSGSLRKENFSNLHPQIFEKPTSLMFSMVQQFINLDIILFESELEFYQWALDNTKKI